MLKSCFFFFFQTKTKEVENGDVSFKPSDETVEVKSKKESPKTPEPKMVKKIILVILGWEETNPSNICKHPYMDICKLLV
jgi:hypothetical protein